MDRPRNAIIRLFLGVATILPTIFCAEILLSFVVISGDEWLAGGAATKWVESSMVFWPIAAVSAMVLTIYYLVFAYRETDSESDRMFWTFTLVFLFPVSGPIFWYRVIWKEIPIQIARRKA